jgi:hypothetical protein
MRHKVFSSHYHAEDIAVMVKLNFYGRIKMHRGSDVMAPGIAVHPAAGHSAGSQFVKVETVRGPVAPAGDAAHYYENILMRRPHPVVYHVGDMIMMESFDRIREAVPTTDHPPSMTSSEFTLINTG